MCAVGAWQQTLSPSFQLIPHNEREQSAYPDVELHSPPSHVEPLCKEGSVHGGIVFLIKLVLAVAKH